MPNNKEHYQQDHFLMSSIKNNVFPLIGVIGAVITLWGMTQTLPLKSEITLNKQSIIGNVEAVHELRDDMKSEYETKEGSDLKDKALVEVLKLIQKDISEIKKDIKELNKR